ncbi:MAG: LysM peptidoglycan-binding domain-containing protein [candidate division Zixibacteria bacterium]|nr:LysM peptidoglycan-binding domain-containing protein [candidate division Zixibacteria bacterium]
MTRKIIWANSIWICFVALITLVLVFSFTGCGGKSGLASPQTYGNNSNQTQDDSSGQSGNSISSETKKVIKNKKDSGSGYSANVSDTILLGNSENNIPIADDKTDWMFYSGGIGIDDSASAVDDAIWRNLDLADEYHAMGVIANREGNWDEAQYYFEEALQILAALDIESDSLETPESSKYTIMLDNIIADYRVALRSLGHLDRDVSASAVIERFYNLGEGLSNDTIVVFKKPEQKITYDLPIVMNDRVKKSIVYYQTIAREAFTKFLVRSKKYKPMMQEIISQYNLPKDLVYLSMVESGYNPRAYSWARASGLWQFISSTGRLYDLNRSWWYDERRDPVKSTHAACQFLKDLYEEFGSWDLAMAAYNGGPGRMRKTIRRQKTKDFWEMRLHRQTMDYIPLIMAATIITKEPEKYGFNNIDFEDEVVWDEIEIDKCLELSVIAKTVGCTTAEIKNLNPELLRHYTPPNTKHYKLKIPKGTRSKFLAEYSSLPSPKETSWVRHKIRRGETVSTIAARYGVSQYAILESNNLSRRSTIYAGKKLIVPVPLDKSPRSYRSKHEYKANNSIYSVRSGDTMWDIAKAFGTTVSALRRNNYVEHGSRIYVGQKLKIPSDAKYFAIKNVKSSTSGGYAKSDGNKKSKSGKYKVRYGDTLWDIARKYGITTSKIRQLNGIGRSSRIYPGQVLTVSMDNAPNYVIHRVRLGETLSLIARKYHTTMNNIIKVNRINNPDFLRVGEKLRIYLN